MEPDWTEAFCRSHKNPDLWFDLHWSTAARLCREECPLVDDCLAWAIRNGEGIGVWGGLPGHLIKQAAKEVAA